ncbi:MAG: DUF2442 domain-containing protein [Holophaga sp.]|jgi:hypothetical protein
MRAVRVNDEKVKGIRYWIEAAKVHVEMEDGREAAVPIAWYPRLAGAGEHELLAFKIMGGGRLIHWPRLEEALGIETILHGIPGQQPPTGVLLPRALRIRALRVEAKLTQVELAHRLGCSQALVSMAEKGKTWVGSDWESRVRKACRNGKPLQSTTVPVRRSIRAKVKV